MLSTSFNFSPSTNTFQRLFKWTLGIDDWELNILEPEIVKIDIEQNHGTIPVYVVDRFKNTLVLDNASDFEFERWLLLLILLVKFIELLT